MTLTGIVAMTPDRVIGRDGALPWHLPADLKFFKRTTLGHPIVMGRTTFESIGRPLPRRRNLVLTRDPEWRAEGVETLRSPAALSKLDLGEKAFIIGGAEVFRALLDQLDELLVSMLRSAHDGDTFFPPFEHLFGIPLTLESHDAFEVLQYLKKPDS